MLARSVPELVRDHVTPKLDAVSLTLPLPRCIAALRMCHRQARTYDGSGDGGGSSAANVERAYLFHLRFVSAFVERVTKHKDFRAPQYKADVSACRKDVLWSVARCELLKPKLVRFYEELNAAAAEKPPSPQPPPTVPSAAPALPPPQEAPQPTMVFPPPPQTLPQQPPMFQLPQPQPSQPQPPPQSLYGGIDIDDHRPQQPMQPPPQQMAPATDDVGPALRAAPDGALVNFTDRAEADPLLRKVVLNGEIFQRFMEYAAPNTSKGLETCALLGAVLHAEGTEELRVTHVVLPQQKGCSDSCTMEDEDAVFSFFDKHGLLACGWVHTHPTQSLFMSSVDLHTHFPQQQLLPEAIAIVVAPKFDPNFGFFSLTARGLAVLGSCTRTGFHPHQEPALYCHPAHCEIRWGENPQSQFVDLRH